MGDAVGFIDLIHRAKHGDVCAFEDLVRLHERLVYRIAYRFFLNPEDAADIAQEAFLKAYKNITHFSGTSFKSWLCTITTNACIDELRKRKNKIALSMDQTYPTQDGEEGQQYKSEAPDPLDKLTGEETYQEIVAAINLLSIDYRTMIILRDLEGLSYEEIAQATGTKLGTVKSKLSRARKHLREILYKP